MRRQTHSLHPVLHLNLYIRNRLQNWKGHYILANISFRSITLAWLSSTNVSKCLPHWSVHFSIQVHKFSPAHQRLTWCTFSGPAETHNSLTYRTGKKALTKLGPFGEKDGIKILQINKDQSLLKNQGFLTSASEAWTLPLCMKKERIEGFLCQIAYMTQFPILSELREMWFVKNPGLIWWLD